MNTTWIQIMRYARALEEGRRAGLGIESQDAERLVAMLLDFQRRALQGHAPSGPPVPPAPVAAAPSPDEDRP
jgi:hypothetical protein